MNGKYKIEKTKQQKSGGKIKDAYDEKSNSKFYYIFQNQKMKRFMLYS